MKYKDFMNQKASEMSIEELAEAITKKNKKSIRDAKIKNKKGTITKVVDSLTVIDLIKLLLDKPMNNLIVIKKNKKKINNATIWSEKPKGLGALFG